MLYMLTHANNTQLHFQPIPKIPELQSRIPAGRSAVEAVPYKPPVPAFGPGSVEHARRMAEVVELEEREREVDRDGDGEGLVVNADDERRSPEVSRVRTREREEEVVGTYAGAGSYF
jgi:hypothetical protein